MSGYSHMSIQNRLPNSPQSDCGRVRPTPLMPVIAMWSSAQEVGSSMGKWSRSGVPPLCAVISARYEPGSRYPPSSSSTDATSSGVGGVSSTYSPSA